MYVLIQNKVNVRAIISTRFDPPFPLMNNKSLEQMEFRMKLARNHFNLKII